MDYTYEGMIDLKTIPFSRFGTYFVISIYYEAGENVLYLRDVRGGDLTPGKQFRIDFLEAAISDNGERVWRTITNEQLHINGTETMLTVTKKSSDTNFDSGMVCFCYQDEDTLRITGRQIAVRMKYIHKKYDNIYPIKENHWELCSYSKELKYGLWQIKGELVVDAPWDTIGNSKIEVSVIPEENQGFDFAIESYKVLPKKREEGFDTFENVYLKLKIDYDEWYKKTGEVPAYYEKGKKLAAYITWANFVKPEGRIPYPAMYMTKNWMTNIWSWDNCFSAIFLAPFEPELAYNQFMMFVDSQHESGVFPDYLNDTYASYSCTKPPIYGWTYDYLMRRNEYFKDKVRLIKVYKTISKQTEFWLNYRRSGFDLPYYAHGNDSGWDNSTLFSAGIPTISPDLSAFLIYQTEFLSRIAKSLDKESDFYYWIALSEHLLETLQDQLWHGSSFKAFSLGSLKWIDEGDSLQCLLPLIIGERLKPDIRSKMLSTIKDKERFNAPYGLATEALNSEFYRYNGYWRGPVWAPVMLLFVESLYRLGETSFAKDLVKRFLQAPLNNGMAENFDPLTGEGLVAPAFAWTSAVYMILLTDKTFSI